MTWCDKPQGSFLFRLDLPTDHGTPFRTSVEYQRVAKRTMERTGDPPVPVGDPPTGTAKRAAPSAGRNELRHTLRFMPGRLRGRAKPRFGFGCDFGFSQNHVPQEHSTIARSFNCGDQPSNRISPGGTTGYPADPPACNRSIANTLYVRRFLIHPPIPFLYVKDQFIY